MPPSGRKPRVLVFVDYYLPGFRFGGIVTAVSSLIERLGTEFEFFVVTAPRDAHSPDRYPNISLDDWNPCGPARVFYTDDDSPRTLRRIYAEIRPDLVYLNSFWSRWTRRVLLLSRLGMLPRTPLLIAPRGEFSSEALAIKRHKKLPYTALSRALSLTRGAHWHATSEHEGEDILRFTGAQLVDRVLLAPDLAPNAREVNPASQKHPGKLRAVAISRIAPMKNFDFLIDCLRSVHGRVELDLYGPIDDAAYWAQCQKSIAQLPPNITVRHAGFVERQDVPNTLQQYDVHALPSRGENFGYSIVESLSVGIPVLISDRTPWHGLESAHAGWDLPLDRGIWVNRLNQLVAMDATEHQHWRKGAQDYYMQHIATAASAHATTRMFETCMRTSANS
ncbi:MAG TPA: glycosyltransferase family 4 protein [Terriglobales bacterium]|jgi:glycosyltransferase involved in cell wall biosynthesis